MGHGVSEKRRQKDQEKLGRLERTIDRQGTYPPLGTNWFWKTMIPIVAVHSGVVCGLVWLDLNIPEVNRMPRWLYGLAAVVLFLEAYVAGRFIETCQPR
jgi:hypothetical protein